jgi:hypothetical protein
MSDWRVVEPGSFGYGADYGAEYGGPDVGRLDPLTLGYGAEYGTVYGGRVVDPVADPDLIDARVVDAVNRFARQAELVFDDPDGSKIDAYPDYRLVDLYARNRGKSAFDRRFAGFVIDQKRDRSTTTVDLLSHDHWLKARKVYRSYQATAPIDILEDVITTFTPLVWDPAQVTLVDPPQDITRDYRGETVNAVIEDLLEASAREQYRVTNDRVFVVAERDPTPAPRDLTEPEYLSAEWDDDSRGEFNRVRVRYGQDGDQAVVVDDKAAQQDLADEIGSDDPVIIERQKTFEGIKDEQTARTQAQSIIRRGEPIQVGEITTWDGVDLRPGQVLTVVDEDNSIDAEFRIASIEYSWRDDETVVTVAENSEGVEDVLAGLNEELDRVEARAGAISPTTVEFVTLGLEAVVELALTVREKTYDNSDSFRFGDFGQPVGPEGIGGQLGDGLATRTTVTQE